MKEQIITFLKGLFMGTADIIPGVSGGTIALITNIYAKLIHTIHCSVDVFRIETLKPILKGNLKPVIKQIKNIDFKFLIPLVLGIGIAIITLSKVITYLLEEQTQFIYAFFFGLILASGVFVYKQTGKSDLKKTMFTITGFVFAFIFVGLNPLQASNTPLVLFFSGILAITAMLLPGISGAFMLLFLGQYQYALKVLNELRIFEIVSFITGALIGVFIFSKLVDFLLNKYKDYTLAFITGLMLGSLRLPFRKIITTPQPILPIILFLLVGIFIVTIFEQRYNKSNKKR